MAPAGVGAVVVTPIWTVAWVSVITGVRVDGRPMPADLPIHFDTWHGVLAGFAYLPLLLCGPCRTH